MKMLRCSNFKKRILQVTLWNYAAPAFLFSYIISVFETLSFAFTALIFTFSLITVKNFTVNAGFPVFSIFQLRIKEKGRISRWPENLTSVTIERIAMNEMLATVSSIIPIPCWDRPYRLGWKTHLRWRSFERFPPALRASRRMVEKRRKSKMRRNSGAAADDGRKRGSPFFVDNIEKY